MGAIHELRAEYRHYRLDNPQYRWLFMLAEVCFLLVKLVLFAGFLIGCWFLISGRVLPLSKGTVVEVQSSASESTPVPALTAERIALLESIAATSRVGSTRIENVPEAGDTVGTSTDTAALVRASLVLEPASIVLSDSGYTPNYVVTESDAVNIYLEDSLSDNSDTVTPVEITPVEKRGSVGEDWILEQPSGHYTVQIAMTSNRPFLESFADQLPDDQVTAIYPERRTNKGDIQYSLSLGNFSTRFAARNALASLPQVHKRYGAHLRRFEDIHNTVSNFNRNVVQ